MREVPFAIIKAVQNCDSEAVSFIDRHFEGFIASQSLIRYEDEDNRPCTYVDEDLRYAGQVGLYAAIFKFQFKEPPSDFAG